MGNPRLVWSRCPKCIGRGWTETVEQDGSVLIERCARCRGRGEIMVVAPAVVEGAWLPCQDCHELCGSQLEAMEHNGGRPWERCAGCSDGEIGEVLVGLGLDEDDEPTRRYAMGAQTA